MNSRSRRKQKAEFKSLERNAAPRCHACMPGVLQSGVAEETGVLALLWLREVSLSGMRRASEPVSFLQRVRSAEQSRRDQGCHEANAVNSAAGQHVCVRELQPGDAVLRVSSSPLPQRRDCVRHERLLREADAQGPAKAQGHRMSLCAAAVRTLQADGVAQR